MSNLEFSTGRSVSLSLALASVLVLARITPPFVFSTARGASCSVLDDSLEAVASVFAAVIAAKGRLMSLLMALACRTLQMW
jgi:hypothetical protein